MSAPFPFYGSGDAEYFEWAGLVVVFETPPKPDALERMLANAPPVYLADDDPALDGRVLHLSGGQLSHVWIAEHYECDEDDEPDFEGRFPFAATSQVRRFNRDIERWLRGLDGVWFALRAPDWEAGGTEFDAWHDAGLARLDSIRESFGNEDEWVAECLEMFAEIRDSTDDDEEF